MYYTHKKPNNVCECCTALKITYVCIQTYFGTAFLCQCMCLYERYMLKMIYRPEFLHVLDTGRWTLTAELETLDFGHWIPDARL